MLYAPRNDDEFTWIELNTLVSKRHAQAALDHEK
jgi:hypothetical protein